MSITSKTETHFHNIEANTAMLDDVVTGNSSDDDIHTASARPICDDDETMAHVNFIIHTAFNPPAMVEED